MTLVLVVDDEPTIRELIADVLREWGYQVETAADGLAALHLMHRQLPHAIVLDLMMPQLDATGFASSSGSPQLSTPFPSCWSPRPGAPRTRPGAWAPMPV